MADNFDLRQFLTENKLTKNAQLLNENADITQAFSGITGKVTVATIPSLGEDPKFEVMDAQDALAMIKNEAEGAEKVTVYLGNKINRQGDYNRETKGLEGKLGVMIYSKSGNKAYEVYKDSNSLNEGDDKPKVSTLGWKALEQSTDPGISKLLADYEASAAADYDEMDRDQGMMQQYMHSSDPRSYKTIKMLQQLIALAGEKGVDLHPEAPPAKPEEEAKVLGFWDKVKAKVGLKEGSDYGYEVLMDVVDNEYDGDPAIAAAVEDAFYNGDIDTSEFGHDLSAPSRAVAQIANGMDIEAAQQSMGFEEGVKEKETVKENTMTTRERRLVEMVQKAMKENTDLKTYTYTGTGDKTNTHGHDIEQARQSIEAGIDPQGVDQGGEMAKTTVIPEYSTIEELMKEIENTTRRVGDQHKSQEMKKIAEALRGEAQRMEESEHAKHINPNVRKKYLQDATKIEKAAEKLVAALEKEDKKAKPAAAKKEEEPATLAEGFDLKKFLVENKLTRNSRMLSEEIGDVNSPVLQGFNWLSNIQGKLIHGSSGTLESIGNLSSNTINVRKYKEAIQSIPNIRRDPEQLGLLLGDAVFGYLKNHIKFLIHNISDSSVRDFLENPTLENVNGDEKLLAQTLQWKKWTESIPDVKDSKYIGNSGQFSSMIEKPVQQMVAECTSTGNKRVASLVWGILPYLANSWDQDITRSLNMTLDKTITR